MASLDLTRASWCKSSRSAPRQANCVEVAFGDQVVAARDSKAPDGGALVFSAAHWASFLGDVRKGRFEQ
jgi:hypothetical protein